MPVRKKGRDREMEVQRVRYLARERKRETERDMRDRDQEKEKDRMGGHREQDREMGTPNRDRDEKKTKRIRQRQCKRRSGEPEQEIGGRDRPNETDADRRGDGGRPSQWLLYLQGPAAGTGRRPERGWSRVTEGRAAGGEVGGGRVRVSSV